MNKLHIALAATLALGSQFAAAQATVPFEGGQSANGFSLVPSTSTGAARDRAVVSIDSRSGQQSEIAQAQGVPFTGSRSRDEVRAEAATVARELSSQVFEGGQVGFAGTVRTAIDASRTLASVRTAASFQ
jgi:hypothetical protein